MKRSKFDLYSRADYYDELVRLIDGAGDGERVMMATMAFSPEQAEAKRVIASLMGAGKRGAKVSLVVDAYPLLIDRGKWLGPLWSHRQVPVNVGARWRPVLRSLEELEACGVKCALINLPSRLYANPYAGRSHIKYAVIGNRAFVGGCNLNAGIDVNGFSDIDLMVGLDDPEAVEWIVGLAEKIQLERNVYDAVDGEDTQLVLSDTTRLLVDAGVQRRSLIFEQALELIDRAQEHIFITCQFFPNGVTSQHLLAAYERGVKVDIRYNPPGAHVWPNSLGHYGVVLQAKRKLPASFFEHELRPNQAFLHAKVIATEQGAIVGSHNYVSAGVNLGTAEIALLNYDPAFAREAETVMLKELD